MGDKICIARLKNNIFKRCNNKCKDGDFCSKHKNSSLRFDKELYSNELIDSILLKNVATNDINLMKFCLYKYKQNYNGKRKEIIDSFNILKQNIKYYTYNNDKIIILQSLIRGWKTRNINRLKGIGLWNRKICVNDTDFYTFESKNDIEYNYFFSYKDIDNFVYCFDIRSFCLLTNNDNKNPYNRKVIPNYAINNMNKLVTYLANTDRTIDFEKDILNDKQILMQKVIKVFQRIDSFNYNTNINWFLNLNFYLLKKFYFYLEDIWNWRAQLTAEVKKKIVKYGVIFNHYIYIKSLKQDTNTNRKKLQELILDDMNKLVFRGETYQDSSLGALYILIALAMVSTECADSMPWLLSTMPVI
tara:strand:+ start:628 stop:1704 length:1077 start_codon:yes stop_codon:yes gene_type:complete